MTTGEEPVYEFNGFQLEPAKRRLLDPHGDPIKLLPKAFDTLVFLIEHRDRVVSKDDLFSAIWPDAVVEENNLTQNISALRRAFGEKPHDNRFISTISGKGYRFVAPVKAVALIDLEPVRETTPGNDETSEDSQGGRPWIPLALAAAAVIALALGIAGYWYFSGVAANSVRIGSLAVLPFRPIVMENRDEALEMGVTDSLISKLGDADDLRVLPLSAVRRYAAAEADPLLAGRQLNVDSVLEGGVQISSGRVRISAKLLRVSDGRQLWSGQFDEELRDIFTLQDSISQRVAAALARQLGRRPQKAATNNVEAYQLYMRGKHHAYKLILPEVQKGIGFYEQAVALDPNYALAYVELANAYRAMVLTNDASPTEMFPRSKAAAAKAVELDDTLAEAWTAMAFNEFWYDWDWKGSEEHFKRALDLDPRSSQTRAFYAHLLSNIGRHEEAKAQIRRAREIDPINLLYAAMEGQILSLARQYDDSSTVLKAVIDLDPNFWLAHLFMARNHIQRGMWAEALTSCERARDITNGNAEAVGTLGYILGRSGDLTKARALIAELNDRSRLRSSSAYSLSQAYLGVGEKDTALDLLEKAVDQKEPLVVFLKVEPRWDELRTEPRFAELMKRLRFDS